MTGYNPLRDPVVRNLLSLPSKELLERRPELRALMVARYEMLWRACEPHVTGKDAEGNPMFPDYRYVDLGARIVGQMVKVLEVLQPDPVEVDAVAAGRDPHAVKVSADLLALEARMQGATGPEA